MASISTQAPSAFLPSHLLLLLPPLAALKFLSFLSPNLNPNPNPIQSIPLSPPTTNLIPLHSQPTPISQFLKPIPNLTSILTKTLIISTPIGSSSSPLPAMRRWSRRQWRRWGGGGGGGSWWSRFISPLAFANDENNNAAEANPGTPMAYLLTSGFKKYKVSDILFFDQRRRTTVGTEDSFFEMVSLRPNGVYTKAQLQKELETLATCGMFERVVLEGKTNLMVLLRLLSLFLRAWQSADQFRCINVGLMPQTKQAEMDPDMTDKEKLEYL
ncbi:Protein TOC75-3 chloroplastic [Bienertia sinuspersici]